MSTPPPPAWYPDPTTPGGQRWWTGQDWSEHVQPAPYDAVAAPSPAFEPEAPEPPASEPAAVATLPLTSSILPSTPQRRSRRPNPVLVASVAAGVALVAIGGYLLVGKDFHASLTAAPIADRPTSHTPIAATVSAAPSSAAVPQLLGKAALKADSSRANLQPGDARPGYSVVTIHQSSSTTVTGAGHCSDTSVKPSGLRADSNRGIDNPQGEDTGVHEEVSGFDTPTHAAAVLTEERKQDTSGCVDRSVIQSGGQGVRLHVVGLQQHSRGLATADALATIIELQGTRVLYVTDIEQHIGQFLIDTSAITTDEPTHDALGTLREIALVAAHRLPGVTA